MAYSSGGLIEATDYNNLARNNASNIAWVWGTGFGTSGYGQNTSQLATVAATNTVTATQWAGLFNIVNRCLGHQSGAAAQIAGGGNINAVAGEVITSFANISTAVTTINTNKALFNSQGSTVTGTTQTWNPTAVTTSALNQFQDTNVNFASGDAARLFFNAGGQINFVCSAVDNAGTTRSTTLRDLINQAGGITAFRNTTNGGRSGIGGTEATNNTGIGYRNMASFNEVVKITAGGAYASDYVTIHAWSDALNSTNGAVSSTVQFRLAVVSAADTFAADVNLTVSVRADIVYPETTYLTTVWGTPTVNFDNV